MARKTKRERMDEMLAIALASLVRDAKAAQMPESSPAMLDAALALDVWSRWQAMEARS